MANKEHVDRVRAITTTQFRLTEPWKGTGWIVVRDSWFGSKKPVKKSFQTNGLFSILLVKSTNPNSCCNKIYCLTMVRGNIDGIKMMAVLYKDLEGKQFLEDLVNQSSRKVMWY